MTRAVNVILVSAAALLVGLTGCTQPEPQGTVRPVRTGQAVPGGRLTVEALDHAGLQKAWSLPLPGRPEVRNVYVLRDDVVLDVVSRIGGRSHNELIALNRVTGALSWQAILEDAPATSPVEDANNVYIFTENRFYGIEKRTGGRILFRQFQRFTPWGDLATDANFVYAMGKDNRLYAVYKVEHEGHDYRDWWSYDVETMTIGSPQVRDMSLYYVDTKGAIVSVRLDRTMGRLDFKFETDDRIQAPLALMGDRIYVGSADGKLFALGATQAPTPRQQQLWLLPYQAGSAIVSRPYVAGNLVLAQTAQTGFHAVDAERGVEVWSVDGMFDFVSASDGVVHLRDARGSLVGIDAASGQRRWELPAGDFAFAPAAPGSAQIFLVGPRGYVLALTPK